MVNLKLMATASKGAKVAIATLVGIAAGEAIFLGSRGMKGDMEFTSKAVKNAVKPEEFYVKTGRFGKKQAVRRSRNPFNPELKPIKGKPSSDKVIKIKKGVK